MKWRVEICQVMKCIEWETFEVEADDREGAVIAACEMHTKQGFSESNSQYYDPEAPYVDGVEEVK